MSRDTTWQSRRRKYRIRLIPRKPAPPVTNTRFGRAPASSELTSPSVSRLVASVTPLLSTTLRLDRQRRNRTVAGNLAPIGSREMREEQAQRRESKQHGEPKGRKPDQERGGDGDAARNLVRRQQE